MYCVVKVLLLLSLAISLMGCGANSKRLAEAFRSKEQAQADQRAAALVDDALAVSTLPKQPAECGTRIRSGVEASDALDVALEKTDTALYKANNRIARCYTFNERLRRNPAPKDATP